MALSTLTTDHLKNEVRIVLVGVTGAGKSATGNTILDKNSFYSIPSSKSVTKYCKHDTADRFGKTMQIVDAPGFKDNQLSEAESRKQIAQCTVLLSPGIDAILVVIRIGRYTEQDVQSANEFIKTFGSEARRYAIAVFTGSDNLTETYNLQNYIKDADKSLEIFLKEINHRYISVNNKANQDERDEFVKTLLEKIEQMKMSNGRSFYTCEMLEDAEKKIREVEADQLRKIEEKNKKKDEKMKEDALAAFKAQLEIEKVNREEKEKRMKEKDSNLDELIQIRNAYMARANARTILSKAIISIQLVAASAGTGAVFGTIGGPIGTVVGGIIGAAYGVALNIGLAKLRS